MGKYNPLNNSDLLNEVGYDPNRRYNNPLNDTDIVALPGYDPKRRYNSVLNDADLFVYGGRAAPVAANLMATVVIAASNSPEFMRAIADVVCPGWEGDGDELVINEYLAAHQYNYVSLFFCEGRYELGGSINLTQMWSGFHVYSQHSGTCEFTTHSNAYGQLFPAFKFDTCYKGSIHGFNLRDMGLWFVNSSDNVVYDIQIDYDELGIKMENYCSRNRFANINIKGENGILIDNCSDNVFEDITIDVGSNGNFSNRLYALKSQQYSTNNTFRNVAVTGQAKYGLWMFGGMTGCKFYNCLLDAYDTGLFFPADAPGIFCDGLSFYDCTIKGYNAGAMNFQPNQNNGASSWLFERCSFSSSNGPRTINYQDNGRFQEHVFKGCNFGQGYAAPYGESGMGIYFGQAEGPKDYGRFVVIGCTFQLAEPFPPNNQYYYGIYNRAPQCYFHNNVFMVQENGDYTGPDNYMIVDTGAYPHTGTNSTFKKGML